MSKLIITAILVLLAGCIQQKEEFCGTSSYSSCATESDCIIGGCSSQVCQSKDDEQMFTTCEYMECYNSKDYECICKESKCQWSKL